MALAVWMVVHSAAAQTTTTLDKESVLAMMQTKIQQISKIKTALETQWTQFNSSGSCFSDPPNQRVARSFSGCGSELPASAKPVCDRSLGDTKGCKCSGKKRVEKVLVKNPNPLAEPQSHASASSVACFAANEEMVKAYRAASGAQDYQNKLMYFGSVDGVMAYYPGVLWNRANDDTSGQLTCDPDYDPRKRSWFLYGSNGPKNVVLILDSSGSMKQSNRMTLLKAAAKQVVGMLTASDFMAIVDFDSDAKTYLNYKFMFRAKSGFRDKMMTFINQLEANGGTKYKGAFERAFEVADTSYRANYHSNCQTVFVFLTDGESDEDPTRFLPVDTPDPPKL